MYMVTPLPIGSSAEAVPIPTANAATAAPARRIFVFIVVSPLLVRAAFDLPGQGSACLFGRTCPAESPYPPDAREESGAPLGFVDIKVENDGDQEDEAAHGIDPGAGEAGRHKAWLHHCDDE